VEGVQSWAGDQSGLVGDPQVADRVEGVGKDNALETVKRMLQIIQILRTYSVTQAHLEDWTILLRKLVSRRRMVTSKLKKRAKDRQSRNLWQVLDVRGISAIEVFDQEEDDRNNCDTNSLGAHDV
jgi:hypothetical protein